MRAALISAVAGRRLRRIPGRTRPVWAQWTGPAIRTAPDLPVRDLGCQPSRLHRNRRGWRTRRISPGAWSGGESVRPHRCPRRLHHVFDTRIRNLRHAEGQRLPQGHHQRWRACHSWTDLRVAWLCRCGIEIGTHDDSSEGPVSGERCTAQTQERGPYSGVCGSVIRAARKRPSDDCRTLARSRGAKSALSAR